MENHLYLYINKPNNVMKAGILTPYLVPEKYYLNNPMCKMLLEHGKIDKISKEAYLKRISDHFGEDRLHSILVITEPISKLCPKITIGKLGHFFETRELFQLPSYEELKELGFVSDLIERCGKENPESHLVKQPDYSPIDWLSINGTLKGFGGIRHYQMKLVNDKISVEFVRKLNFIYKEEVNGKTF